MEMNLQEIWMERIRAYQTSGQTMKAWSAEHQVTLHQLKYWLYKFQRQEQTTVAPTFCPVTVVPSTQTGSTESLQLQVGAARIDVRAGFEPALLREVVAALATLC